MDNAMVSLPGWETVRCIGSGSSGKVYELRKKDEYGSDFHSALKVISIPATAEEYERLSGSMSEFALRAHLREQVEQISSEYRLMGVLKGHPNIVSCEDTMIVPHDSDAGWDIYIRMELLTSLPDFVQQNGITGADVIKLGSDICNALETCRKNGIMHRDIKPQNIFVSKYGDFKLGDFGVARLRSDSGTANKVGTYSYMAPEVYKLGEYSDSVDIYSLGMVLYWLLNERRGPFLPLPPQVPTPEQSADAQLRRYRGEKLPPPKNGSATLKNVVLKACAYDSSERYQTPAEMKKALTLAGMVSTRRAAVGSEEPTVKEEIPQRPPVRQTVPSYQPPPPEPEKPEEKALSGFVIVLIIIITLLIVGLLAYVGVTSGLFDKKPVEPAPKPQQTEVVTEPPEETPEPYKVHSLVMSSPSLAITEGTVKQLSVTAIPEPTDAQQLPTLVWKSSDSSVATVDDGSVTAVAAGVVTVRVYVEDDMEVYDECTVTVEPAELVSIEIEQEPYKTEYRIAESIEPEGLIIRAYYNNDSVERISDTSLMEISGDTNGLGERRVTVSYKGVSSTYMIKVSLF